MVWVVSAVPVSETVKLRVVEGVREADRSAENDSVPLEDCDSVRLPSNDVVSEGDKELEEVRLFTAVRLEEAVGESEVGMETDADSVLNPALSVAEIDMLTVNDGDNVALCEIERSSVTLWVLENEFVSVGLEEIDERLLSVSVPDS